MPITKIDQYTALVVIDLQKGIQAVPAVPYPASEVIARSAQLASAFRQQGLPVVLVNAVGGAPGRIDLKITRPTPAADFADLVPELKQQASDYLVTKRRWGAFQATALDQYLRERGVTQVVITGIATCMGVESTARHAHELGYNVTVIVDAVSDRSLETHQNSVERIFPRLGETATTEEFLALLQTRTVAY